MKILFKLPAIFLLFHLAYGSEETSSIRSPYVKEGDSIFLTGDFLYWTTQIDGLEFARSGSTGAIKNLPSSWNPGFRVGIGSILPHDKWEVFFEYTRIQTKQSQHVGAGYFPLWIGGGLAESSKAIQTQTFNDLNISLGRTFIPSKKTLFYPFIGIKGTYDVQHYLVGYENVAPRGLFNKETNVSIKTRQLFWGVGILAGFNSEWLMTKYLGLFGNFYFAGLSSHFKDSRKDFLAYTETPDKEATVANIKNKFFTLQAMFDLELGLKTDLWFSDDRYHFSIQAGWELQTWLHQNQTILLFSPSSRGGNLSFQGLTLKTRFDF